MTKLSARIIEVARAVGAFRRDVREALSGGALGGAHEDSDTRGYRRLGDAAYRRDLDAASIETMQSVAHNIYTRNSLAAWLLDVRVNMVVGGSPLTYSCAFDHEHLGITRERADELAADAKRYLDAWWRNPAHDFQVNALRYATTYLLTGEMLMYMVPAQDNPVTGAFTLEYIDSAKIDKIAPMRDLSSTPGTAFVKTDGNPIPLEIVRQDAFGKWQGVAFYWHHTRRLNALRGLSDLLAVADLIDLHEQLWFAFLDRALLANNLVNNITCTGARTAEELRRTAAEFKKATEKPGGAWAHSETVNFEQVVPDLRAMDQVTLANGLLTRILGSFSIPHHWFSEGDGTNRATAEEQTSVTLQALSALQSELRSIFELPLAVAYDRLADLQRIFPQRADGGVTLLVNMPVLDSDDVERLARSAQTIVATITSSIESGLLSQTTGQRVVARSLSALGIEIDAEAERAQIEAERTEQEESAAAQANELARAALDAAGEETSDEEDEEDDGEEEEAE